MQKKKKDDKQKGKIVSQDILHQKSKPCHFHKPNE